MKLTLLHPSSTSQHNVGSKIDRRSLLVFHFICGLYLVFSSRMFTSRAFPASWNALDDLDNDGDEDVVVLNLDDQPQLIRNSTKNAKHFLQLQLVGKHSNRDAVGSLVTVRAGEKKAMAQAIVSGRGFQSHFGSRLSFGLGQTPQAWTVSVQWHGDAKQEFVNVTADQFIILIEGETTPIPLR